MVGVEKRGKGKKERETLRGLTITGVIKMSGSKHQRLRCIMVCDKFPSCLPHCGALTVRSSVHAGSNK